MVRKKLRGRDKTNVGQMDRLALDSCVTAEPNHWLLALCIRTIYISGGVSFWPKRDGNLRRAGDFGQGLLTSEESPVADMRCKWSNKQLTK